MVSESIVNEVNGGAGPAVTQHVYDIAGQLLSTQAPDGVATRYSYDGAGRRVRAAKSNGQAREFVWNPTGYLAGIIRHDRDDRVRRITVHADALG